MKEEGNLFLYKILFKVEYYNIYILSTWIKRSVCFNGENEEEEKLIEVEFENLERV